MSGNEFVHDWIQLNRASCKPQIVVFKVWCEYQIIESLKISVRHLWFQEGKLEFVIMRLDVKFCNLDGHAVWLLLDSLDLVKNFLICLKSVNLPILSGSIVV